MPVVVPPSIAAAAAVAAAADDGRPYVTWKDKKYLLSMEVVMTALQDEGTVDKSGASSGGGEAAPLKIERQRQ